MNQCFRFRISTFTLSFNKVKIVSNFKKFENIAIHKSFKTFMKIE